MQWINRVSDHHQSAASKLAKATVQVDCWAISSDKRTSMAKAARDAVDGIRGLVMGGVTVRVVTVEDQTATFEPPTDGSEQGTYRERLDVEIDYFRNVPTF